MSTEGIIFIAFPSIIIGFLICSTIFSIILTGSSKLKKKISEGSDAGKILAYGYICERPDAARKTSGCKIYRYENSVRNTSYSSYNRNNTNKYCN